MTDYVVYAQEGRYAGWPANHGAWQWGDEFLVGFLEGPYKAHGIHHIGQPRIKMFARSLDGGHTWKVEDPNQSFMTDDREKLPVPFDILRGKRAIVRFCGDFDHGGEGCSSGGFYASPDGGKGWLGPFTTFCDWLPIEYNVFTSRTAYLPEGLVFLSVRKEDTWGWDRTYCTKWSGDPDKPFSVLGMVGDDGARCVMPAVARSGDRLFCVLRRSVLSSCWNEAYCSDDGGITWRSVGEVADSGANNGNPPAALTLADGRVLVCLGDRTRGCLIGRIVDPERLTMGEIFVVRYGAFQGKHYYDFGYPRLLMRSDGVPVCIHYWASKERPYQHIAASEVRVP